MPFYIDEKCKESSRKKKIEWRSCKTMLIQFCPIEARENEDIGIASQNSHGNLLPVNKNDDQKL
jgi:hypothetical protein